MVYILIESVQAGSGFMCKNARDEKNQKIILVFVYLYKVEYFEKLHLGDTGRQSSTLRSAIFFNFLQMVKVVCFKVSVVL